MTESIIRFVTVLLALCIAESLVWIGGTSSIVAVFMVLVPLRVRACHIPGLVLILNILTYLLGLGIPVLAAWAGGLIAFRVIGHRSRAVIWAVAPLCVLMALATFLGGAAGVYIVVGERPQYPAPPASAAGE